MINKVIRTSALAIAAMVATSMMSSEANAQSCYRGGGWGGGYGVGGSGFSLSIGTGYGGWGGYYGGFNRGVSINTFRPTYYGRPVHWNTGRYYGAPVRVSPHFHTPYYHSHRVGHWHR